ncbi:hypothetical protein FRC18_002285 [Serendipita sp. 400]|nr:hypothetical protein FRC18_002285 [Serendipita sp. 400]
MASQELIVSKARQISAFFSPPLAIRFDKDQAADPDELCSSDLAVRCQGMPYGALMDQPEF